MARARPAQQCLPSVTNSRQVRGLALPAAQRPSRVVFFYARGNNFLRERVEDLILVRQRGHGTPISLAIPPLQEPPRSADITVKRKGS